LEVPGAAIKQSSLTTLIFITAGLQNSAFVIPNYISNNKNEPQQQKTT